MPFKKTILSLLLAVSATVLFTGCAGDSYNAYDNRSYEDRKIDYAAQNAVNDAAASLSAQDIKNINNLK
ncbi:MAG TPA: hypothetical protein ENJ71_03875 [Epsilonproteobacteria bacterium]|nr:hypothetical protein [Campylobacterota bacterium]